LWSFEVWQVTKTNPNNS